MAKEAGKPKPKVKKKAKDKKKPSYCPNKSKSLNLSTTRSQRFESVSVAALKRNNEELAKTLNQYKEALARLEKERNTKDAQLMDMRMELATLRASPDPQEVEAEVQRRVKLHISKINGDIRTAIDHTLGLSNILTQLCVNSSRASQACVSSSSSGIGVATPGPRHSDIGGVRVRQVVSRQARNQPPPSSASESSTWTRTEDQSPKQLSKVSPMVAGHAISRPRIQLERMDPAMLQSVAQDDEVLDQGDVPEEASHEDEELSATPPLPPPSRNVFDLTNIREESYVMEDSIMDETVISPATVNMEAVQEENQEDVDQEEASTSTRSSLQMTTSTVRRSASVSRACLRPPPEPSQSQSPASFSPAIVSTQADQSPAIPDTSPYVLESETTPVGLPRLQPGAGEPSARRTATADPNHSSSLTESFLEQMMDINDPMEGPSWLFASVKKKKRRSSAVKKLSCIMSDLDNSEDFDNSLDNSNLGDGARGSILDKDLLLPVTSNQDEDDQENVPLEDEDGVNISIQPRNQVTVTPRTPLSSLKSCLDDGGNKVNLKEARVMLNNVSNVSLEGTSSVEESPVLTNRKKTLTLDELFSLGTRDDFGEEASSSNGTKRKFGSEPRIGESNKPTKKPRTTELPQTTSEGFNLMQNLEVRIEKNVSLGNEENIPNQGKVSLESQGAPEGGRSRRTKAVVSYKEPALGKKLRQGDAGSSTIYQGSEPKIKKKTTKKPKIK